MCCSNFFCYPHITTPPPPPPPANLALVCGVGAPQVCELDIIFNFHKAYYILDELFIGGELQETNKRELLKVIAAQDELMVEKESGR